METSNGSETEPKPIVINIEPIEETQRGKEVRVIANNARSLALKRLGRASDLTDYLRWHRTASVYLTPPSIDWIWDYGGTTPEELIEEQLSDRFTEGYARNSRAAEVLKPIVDALEPKEGRLEKR